MYNVLIVDDEPIIAEGLKRSIKWEQYGCQVIATANSGFEALEILQETTPHIVISDISMPGMDGLSMIASIKSQHKDVQVSVLTGYRNFDYAQEAIRLGVTRFLCKPSKMNELTEAIQLMVENLDMKQVLQEKSCETVEKIQSSEDTQLSDDVESVDNPSSCFIVKNALEYLENNYQKKIKLSDVADETYVSQWHLSKLLNRHTGQNFSDILNGIRIDHAKELLEDPGLRIGDIAEEVGFLDMAHFSRVFKKHAGVSANEYRNTVIIQK